MASDINCSPATVPFSWEEKPGVPNPSYKFLEKEFAFDVSEESSSDSIPAEDLFDCGLIKSKELKIGSSISSFSRLPSSKSRRTQSFSTRRGWECPWEEQEQGQGQERQTRPAAKNINKLQLGQSFSSLSASSSTAKKWRFMDMFLFRSASDGQAMDRDPLKKYSAAIFKKHDEDLRNSTRKDAETRTHGSGSGSGSKTRCRISAHELHYKVNRAVANDMKKKTFLPYKQGILGRLAFNPTVDALSNGFGFSHK